MPAPETLQTQTPGEPIKPNTEQINQQPEPEYTAKHNGGGRWRIWAATTDDWFSDFVAAGEGAKELAQVEADRLIAGGEPYFKPADPAPEAATTTDVQATTIKPNTEQINRRAQAVLTDEGWLVPDLPARKE
ncbi:hypothetical protein D3C77_165980 [compost metagenome]